MLLYDKWRADWVALKGWKIMEQIISDAIGYVHQVFRNDFSGHDAYHSMRVYKTAVEIAAEEGADATLVALAALLHDVDDRKLSPETAAGKNRAVQFLQRESVPPKMISAICTVIDQVSYRGTDSVVPSTLEGKCVQDADRLDALGAIGIARTFAYGGSHSRPLYDPEEAPLPDGSRGVLSPHRLLRQPFLREAASAEGYDEHRNRAAGCAGADGADAAVSGCIFRRMGRVRHPSGRNGGQP